MDKGVEGKKIARKRKRSIQFFFVLQKTESEEKEGFSLRCAPRNFLLTPAYSGLLSRNSETL
jgi:hypothetical protein